MADKKVGRQITMRFEKKHCYVAAIAFTLIGCVLCIGVGSSYSIQREPELAFEELLMKQASVLSEDWKWTFVHYVSDTDFSRAKYVASGRIDYSRRIWDTDSIRVNVHVFSTPLRAMLIAPPLRHYTGYIPQGWDYEPQKADRYGFFCNGGDGVANPERCQCIVQYGEYYFDFRFPIGRFLLLEDVRKVLEITDKEMHHFLNNSAVRRGSRNVPTSALPERVLHAIDSNRVNG